MKQLTKRNWFTWAALLLSLPTAYFIVISILKYELGVDGPFDSISPWLERMGIKEAPGWNINLLILLGPVVACLLTVFQLLKIRGEFSQEEFQFHITVRKRWFPLLVTAFSLSLLAALFIYLLGENCNCQNY
jgi:membrane protein insertase Oxa1/YidC/SpoIIIJ